MQMVRSLGKVIFLAVLVLAGSFGIVFYRDHFSADQKIAAVPKTPRTEEIARRIFPRAQQDGIEIALIDATGGVLHIT